MSRAVDPVIYTVYFIRPDGVNNWQFHKFLTEIESHLWDSPCRVISGLDGHDLLPLPQKVCIAYCWMVKAFAVIANSLWPWKLAFAADLSKHVNYINTMLQDEMRLICDVCRLGTCFHGEKNNTFWNIFLIIFYFQYCKIWNLKMIHCFSMFRWPQCAFQGNKIVPATSLTLYRGSSNKTSDGCN